MSPAIAALATVCPRVPPVGPPCPNTTSLRFELRSLLDSFCSSNLCCNSSLVLLRCLLGSFGFSLARSLRSLLALLSSFVLLLGFGVTFLGVFLLLLLCNLLGLGGFLLLVGNFLNMLVFLLGFVGFLLEVGLLCLLLLLCFGLLASNLLGLLCLFLNCFLCYFDLMLLLLARFGTLAEGWAINEGGSRLGRITVLVVANPRTAYTPHLTVYPPLWLCLA